MLQSKKKCFIIPFAQRSVYLKKERSRTTAVWLGLFFVFIVKGALINKGNRSDLGGHGCVSAAVTNRRRVLNDRPTSPMNPGIPDCLYSGTQALCINQIQDQACAPAQTSEATRADRKTGSEDYPD